MLRVIGFCTTEDLECCVASTNIFILKKLFERSGMFHKLKIVFQCTNRVINNNNDKLTISCNKSTCFAAFQQLE